MTRVVITIHPTVSDERLLTVADAMQQVLDSIKLFEDAQKSISAPEKQFVWRPEKATTNSPFTVVAVAEAVNPAVDVTGVVDAVKTEVTRGLRALIDRKQPPSWMTQGSYAIARGMFARNLNGIGETDIAFDGAEVISIDQKGAAVGIAALEAFNVMDFQAGLEARVAFGEIEGVMVAVGRFRNREAVQIKTDLYGFVWCTLPKDIIDKFGSQHEMGDVWAGKTLGVHGRLNYAAGAKLSNIDAIDIREIENVPLVRLEDILDPDFTAGMDPHEYLEKLHEGSLG